jgi:hypothetical protein
VDVQDPARRAGQRRGEAAQLGPAADEAAPPLVVDQLTEARRRHPYLPTGTPDGQYRPPDEGGTRSGIRHPPAHAPAGV